MTSPEEVMTGAAVARSSSFVSWSMTNEEYTIIEARHSTHKVKLQLINSARRSFRYFHSSNNDVYANTNEILLHFDESRLYLRAIEKQLNAPPPSHPLHQTNGLLTRSPVSAVERSGSQLDRSSTMLVFGTAPCWNPRPVLELLKSRSPLKVDDGSGRLGVDAAVSGELQALSVNLSYSRMHYVV